MFKQNGLRVSEIEPKELTRNDQNLLMRTLLVRLHQIRSFSTVHGLLCKEFSACELRIGALFLRS
ncbi:hypothetical protein, partial [Parasutterella excrementihominis]|uniref:hypothetical protein n=1 Tax=Parasutterella excrementihominis TaxID=487175 RepID=UPI003FEE7B0E